MDKKTLRQTYKAKRLALSQDDIESKSLAIANQMVQLPVWGKTFFHIFLPIAEQNEVDTECILHLLSGKDKEIVVSRSDFSTCDMTHILLTDSTRIRKNAYNIPEPVGGIEIPTTSIEVVFVPLLAFDSTGNRVGYGKGFYDRFLAQCNADAIKIGLSFFEAVPEILDVFESDVKLDYCVTPEKIYRF